VILIRLVKSPGVVFWEVPLPLGAPLNTPCLHNEGQKNLGFDTGPEFHGSFRGQLGLHLVVLILVIASHPVGIRGDNHSRDPVIGHEV